MSEGLPETPEGVALVLFFMVLGMVELPQNRARCAWMLDLFALCLEATDGRRRIVEERPH